MLSIDHVDAGYRHVRVLHDVSLTAAPGAAVGVLGPNGAGKTTLLRAIAGTCNVYGGRIVFAGQPLNGKPDHMLDTFTIRNNLLCQRLANFAKRVRELLACGFVL